MTVRPKNDSPSDADRLQAFVAAVHAQKPVTGLTHSFYRYPGRFSPLFARAAIEAFSDPGDVILDPFSGGATALVEARASGRHAIGSDISSLAVFLGRVKTTPLSSGDVAEVTKCIQDLPRHLNMHLPAIRASEWQEAGYQRHLPWPIRKSLELSIERVRGLPRKRQQRFARCLLLKVGQWAVDCREFIPSAHEFREELLGYLELFKKGMEGFRARMRDHRAPGYRRPISICLNRTASSLSGAAQFACLPKKPNLVVTSPPYPGVYVLYHRWKVRGRKESPAPFWLADCHDGQGQAYYCFGDRKQLELKAYFNGIRTSFTGIRSVIAPDALVVQMVAFAEPDWQLPKFLEAMSAAGFGEVQPRELGFPENERLWREVPGRRWFALIQGKLATSRELVLFHRPTPLPPARGRGLGRVAGSREQ
jgi:hypothetical protein